MTDDERDHYGRLFCDAATDTIEWDLLRPEVKRHWSLRAKRFIAAAGLVPLAEVRAILKEVDSVTDIDHGELQDWLAGFWAALERAAEIVNERYGEEGV